MICSETASLSGEDLPINRCISAEGKPLAKTCFIQAMLRDSSVTVAEDTEASGSWGSDEVVVEDKASRFIASDCSYRQNGCSFSVQDKRKRRALTSTSDASNICLARILRWYSFLHSKLASSGESEAGSGRLSALSLGLGSSKVAR